MRLVSSLTRVLAPLAPALITCLALASGAAPPSSATAPLDGARAEQPDQARLVLYDEKANVGRSGFVPSGFMPDGNGMKLSEGSKSNPHAGETCIRIDFAAGAQAWAGVFWLAGGEWGGRPGINIYDRIGARKGDTITLSFWARCDADKVGIEAKVGGATEDGKKYQDSIPIAVTTGDLTLSREWTRHSIPLTTHDLSSLVGGFCVVVTAAANSKNGNIVTFYLDDIVIEREGPREAAASPERLQLADAATQVRWVCYVPTEYDPTSTPKRVPSDESIRADLKVLRERFDGLVTYECQNGLERVPRIAKELGFRAVIQGVYYLDSKVEHDNAVYLAREGLIMAICCGNEGIGAPRSAYTLETLKSAMDRLRADTKLPVTTSEQIDDYQKDPRLIDSCDFLCINAHPTWSRIFEVPAAIKWLDRQMTDLRSRAGGRVIIVKETGWPSAGHAAFTETSQAAFWHACMELGREQKIGYVAFEAFDIPWKKDEHMPTGTSVGEHWGIYDSTRRPKPAAESFPLLKK